MHAFLLQLHTMDTPSAVSLGASMLAQARRPKEDPSTCPQHEKVGPKLGNGEKQGQEKGAKRPTSDKSTRV